MSYDCYCDGNSPAWTRIAKVKSARKSYRCAECGISILPGQPYEKTIGKWDGDIDVFHTCPLCAELRQWAMISVPCFCWEYGNLHQNVSDMVDAVQHDVPGFDAEWKGRVERIEQARHRAAGRLQGDGGDGAGIAADVIP